MSQRYVLAIPPAGALSHMPRVEQMRVPHSGAQKGDVQTQSEGKRQDKRALGEGAQLSARVRSTQAIPDQPGGVIGR